MHGERGNGDSRRGVHWRADCAGRESSSQKETKRERRFEYKGAGTMTTATANTETMEKSTSNPVAKVVPRAEWLAARKELLTKEKEFTRLRDDLSRQRREMPWEKVDKTYVFGGPNGKETLDDLFGGKSQLII